MQTVVDRVFERNQDIAESDTPRTVVGSMPVDLVMANVVERGFTRNWSRRASAVTHAAEVKVRC